MDVWNKSLTARLAGTFLLLSLVTVSVVGALAFVQARAELERLVRGQLELASSVRQDEIQRWVEQQRAFVGVMAQAPELRGQLRPLFDENNPGGVERAHRLIAAYLQGVSLSQHDFLELALLDDADGRILVSTSSEHEGLVEVSAPYVAYARMNMHVEPAYLSRLNNRPTITIAAPLTDETGRRRAILAAHLDLERLDAFMGQPTGLGATARVYLVGRFALPISAARPVAGLPPSSEGIAAALSGSDGVGLYEDASGAPVIGAHAWLDDLDLALIVELAQYEAFAPAQRVAVTIFGVGLISTVLLAAAVVLLAQRITRPLTELTHTASEVATGDLRQSVPVTTDDEIGVLARAFNQMTTRLDLVYGELRRSEEHFRTLIEHASDAILIVGDDGSIRYDGPSIEEVLGYPHHALRGQPLGALVHPEDRVALLEAIALCLRDGEQTLALEFRFRDAEGAWRVLEGRGQRLEDVSGLAGVVINARDISERKQAEEERARLQEENLRVRTEFIATVSHELRTPLTPIRGYVDLLLLGGGGALSELQASFVQVIKNNALRMQSLVDDLLDIGRIQAGRVRLSYARVDLAELLGTELNLFQQEIARKRLDIRLEIEPELPPIQADPRRLSQIAVNLISNAIKYTLPGGRVRLRAQSDGQGCVELEVQDTGVGLTPEQQEKLFTPFYRADNGLRAEVGGTGLGLCIVKSFVELHGGTITVRSAKGKGSTFTVRLPLTGAAQLPPLEDEPSALQLADD
jgi:PAS domain S-box-containing protein